MLLVRIRELKGALLSSLTLRKLHFQLVKLIYIFLLGESYINLNSL